MKKIFLAIAIVFAAMNCMAQDIELKVNKGGEVFTLHPKKAHGLNTEKVTTFTTTYEGAVIVNERTIQYEIVDANKIAIENNNKLRGFALTELGGCAVGLVGCGLAYYGAKNQKEWATWGGVIMGVGGAITCIVGYLPLIGDKIYFTENGIGVKLNIK